ncbi:MAG TPA: glycine cleavage system protein GcvH [Anaerolineae bacterium]|nr:glycine cleavage system protein GcvH [Anaerolineae bacterium]
MDIGGFEFPDDLYYDKEHNWARVEDGVVAQGFTELAQAIAKEIVFVEVPRTGRKVTQGETFMSLESGKWVGRVRAVISGVIQEANEELEWEPTLINESPYDEGWFVKIEASDLGELDNLMRPSDPEFVAFIQAEMEKYKDVLGK